MGSVLTGRSVDKRSVVGLLLGCLVLFEILLGSLVAMRPEHSTLALLAAIAPIVILATFLQPVFGLYLFVATIFTEALLMLGSVSAARLLGVLVLAAWITHSLASGHFEITVPKQGWFAMMFVVWGLVSAIWAMDTQKLFAALLLLIQSLALYILVINLVNTAKKLRTVLAIVVVVSLALALITVFRVLSGELVGGRVDLGQISVRDMNAQAAYFLPSAALLMVLLSQRASFARRMLLLFGLVVVTVAILATSSRAAMLSLVVVLFLGVIIKRRMWRVALPAFLAGGVALVLLPGLLGRVESIFTLSDRGAGRLDIWLVALQIIRSNPIHGIGLDSFGRAFDKYLPETVVSSVPGAGMGSHNIFLNVQSELGVIGLILFAVFLAMTLKSGLVAAANLRRAGDTLMADLALAVWLALVGMLVIGLFIDLQYWKLFWLLLALPVVMRRLAAEAAQETAIP